MLDILSTIFFFFNDTATTEIYTLSLHNALPIYLAAPLVELAHKHQDGLQDVQRLEAGHHARLAVVYGHELVGPAPDHGRSEEHTSELQSRQYLECRLLLEKKNNWHTN